MEGYRRSGGGDQRAKGENDLPRSEKTSVQEIPAAAAAQRSAIINCLCCSGFPLASAFALVILRWDTKLP